MRRLMLFTLACALALLFILPACGGSGGGGGGGYSLVGTWQTTEIDGIAVPKNTMVFVFNPNGTGALTGAGQTQDFVWSQTGNSLTLTGGGETDTVPLGWIAAGKVQVTIDGDVLLLVRA